MKISCQILSLCLLLIPAAGIAENLFREVTVLEDSWEITFKESGVRFIIEIDGKNYGVSEYSQKLRLKNGQKLRLVEKHTSLEIRPVRSNRKTGIQLVATHRNGRTGELKTDTSFEAAHKSDQE